MAVEVLTTAYGAASLDALRSVVAEAKLAEPMSPVTLLVPNNVAGIVARRNLARGMRDDWPGVAGLYVSTLPRLAEQLASPALTGQGRRPATRPVIAAAWRAALDGGRPGVFSEVAEHPATIRALTAAHIELRDLSGPALEATAGASQLVGDVVRLHREVVGKVANQWYDTTDVLRTATAVAADHPHRLRELGRIVLWQPQDLTQAESGFAAALAGHAEVTVLAAMTGVQRADRAVLRSLKRIGAEPPEESPKPPVASAVFNASDADDEVRCAVREVVGTLLSTPPHRVAVLYSTADPYARLLHEHLAAAGIAVNGPGVRAVHERATARCLLEVLALGPSNMPRGDVFRALAEAPTHDFTGELIPVARWERLSRSAGVVGGDDWQQRLDHYVAVEREAITTERAGEDPSPGRIERSERNTAAAAALRDFATTLRRRLVEGQALTTWGDLSQWAGGLFTDLFGDDAALVRLPPAEQYAATAVKLTLAGLGTLDVVGAPASYAALRDVLELELQGAVPRVGRFGDGVFVAPLSAAIGLDADVVYVLGLAEDLYPGRLHEDALLPQPARDATGGELASSRDRLDAKHRHLLAAFAIGSAPGRRVVASFPRGDLRRSSARLPSRWLLPTLRALSGQDDLAATEWETRTGDAIQTSPSYAGTLDATGRLASEQEWRTRAARAGLDLRDSTVERAVAMIRARAGSRLTRFDGNLSGVTGIPDYRDAERVVSPTALEAYAECPHAFFVDRLLRVEPLEQPEELLTISPLEVGTLIHESFEALVVEYADSLPGYGEPWTAQQKARLAEIADAKARELEGLGLTGHRRLWQRERIRILADLAWMLDDDDTWRQERNAKVVTSELAFGMNGEEPVEVTLPSGRVLMRGSADKVDLGADATIYVTDIKTGSTSTYQHLGEDDPVLGGTRLQLPVYAYAARQRLGDRGTPVEAAYWFVRKDRGKRIGVPLTPAVEATYAATLDVVVRAIAAGLFPQRPPESPDWGWVQCVYCNPDGRGHGEARERWERKLHDPALAAYVALVDPDELQVDA